MSDFYVDSLRSGINLNIWRQLINIGNQDAILELN